LKAKPRLSPRECTLLRGLCESRIDALKDIVQQVSYSKACLMAKEIGEIEGLFENLTGFPLNDPEDAA
jgi:hypothetical protein